MKHVIRKQMISLQLTAGHDAFAVQQRAKDYFYEHIAPALEKVLDELSSPGEMICLDRLEIDLGDLTWKNEKLVADSDQIYRTLKQRFSQALSADAGTKTNTVSDFIVSSMEKHACLQWLYYMENGVLPWALQHTHAAWLEQVLHQLAIDHVLIEKTKDKIRHHRWFLLRVVRDHTEQFLQQLAGVIAAKPQPGLMQMIDISARLTELKPSEYRRFKHRLWSDALLQFSEGKTTYQPEEATPGLPVMRKVAEFADDSPRLLLEGIFCSFAGVVLLHSFFRHLFNHLALLENGKFINDAARQKAVLLIYYAATGETAAQDHELVVAKTLCGMPLTEVPDEGAWELTEPEKQEAQNMIQAAIEQWPIMQHTSIEGLQESFLRREGKLIQEQNNILFRMETSGIDVLLDHLPWNLSIIKFPWLDQLVRVEWR
jgi:hypothetical protein